MISVCENFSTKSLIIMEKQIKPTRYHFIAVILAHLTRYKAMYASMYPFTDDGKLTHSTSMEDNMNTYQKRRIQFLQDPEIQCLTIYPKGPKTILKSNCTPIFIVHCSISP